MRLARVLTVILLWSVFALALAVGCGSQVHPNPWELPNGVRCDFGEIVVDYGHGPAWACAPDPDAGVD